MTSQEKSELRYIARETRKTLVHAGFAHAIARHAESLPIAKGAIIGGYHALPEEADPHLLLERLVEMGFPIAFPRVSAKGQPLDFHRVPDDGVLAPSIFGIHEPLAIWSRVTHAVLLVPLLAFDASGHRLGYGGGFYDRTLALLDVPAIGIAYAGQEVASIPHEAHDRTLVMVLTEQGIRHF